VLDLDADPLGSDRTGHARVKATMGHHVGTLRRASSQRCETSSHGQAVNAMQFRPALLFSVLISAANAGGGGGSPVTDATVYLVGGKPSIKLHKTDKKEGAATGTFDAALNHTGWDNLVVDVVARGTSGALAGEC
jgi:hypothetical protein